jgi:hypothetical protein
MRNWKEHADKVAPPGSLERELADFLKTNGTVPFNSYVAQYCAIFGVDGFTDDQIHTAAGSELQVLKSFKAIEISDGIITWIG